MKYGCFIAFCLTMALSSCVNKPDKEIAWEPDIYVGAPGVGLMRVSNLGERVVSCHSIEFESFICMGKSDLDRIMSTCFKGD
jgi:hypothetical protein